MSNHILEHQFNEYSEYEVLTGLNELDFDQIHSIFTLYDEFLFEKALDEYETVDEDYLMADSDSESTYSDESYDSTWDIENPAVYAADALGDVSDVEFPEYINYEYHKLVLGRTKNELHRLFNITYSLDHKWFDTADFDRSDENLSYHHIKAVRTLLEAQDCRAYRRILMQWELESYHQKKTFKNKITEELMMKVMHPSRIEKHLSYYDDLEEALDNL